MDDACGLRQRLHAQHRPEIDGRGGVVAFARVAAQHEQIVAQYPNQSARRELGREAVDLHRRGVDLRGDRLERDDGLAHDAREEQRAVHNKPPVRLHERARKFAPDARLPLHELAPRLRRALALVHVVRE